MAVGTAIGARPPSGDPPKWKWTRETYHRAADLGVFGPNERVELIRGELYEKMSPQKWPHSSTIHRVTKRLERVFGQEYAVFAQSPMAVSGDSEPEPDVMAIRGEVDDYEDHPTPGDTALVIEVSDSTMAFDRRLKASLYAEAGLKDYWISSVKERCLYVLREPGVGADGQPVYQSVVKLTEDETVSPLAAPDEQIAVRDLLPKLKRPQ